MLRSSVLLLTTRDFINEVFKGHFQGCDFCHGLISKAAVLLFKQSYDNLRSSRREPAASAGTAQSGRCCYRKQSAVCASHNVPSDNKFAPVFFDIASPLPQCQLRRKPFFMIVRNFRKHILLRRFLTVLYLSESCRHHLHPRKGYTDRKLPA